MMPNSTFKLKGEKCVGGKMSKNHLTVLMCVNMTGTDKKRLFVIGKSQKPRCFKSVMKLSVEYAANKKAWMTSDIFQQYISKWNNELRRKNRKILLLVDNCPAHPHIQDLSNIKLVFLPPNATSVFQPMDMGIIKSFKGYFTRLLVLQLIDQRERGLYDNVSLLDSICLMKDAWDTVTPATVINCLWKSGLSSEEFSVGDQNIN
jgi:hypothetical protein